MVWFIYTLISAIVALLCCIVGAMLTELCSDKLFNRRVRPVLLWVVLLSTLSAGICVIIGLLTRVP